MESALKVPVEPKGLAAESRILFVPCRKQSQGVGLRIFCRDVEALQTDNKVRGAPDGMHLEFVS
jgi:hypothetical protein